jgi:hypothetical protein
MPLDKLGIGVVLFAASKRKFHNLCKEEQNADAPFNMQPQSAIFETNQN